MSKTSKYSINSTAKKAEKDPEVEEIETVKEIESPTVKKSLTVEEVPKIEVKKVPRVAHGKSITSKKGILNEDVEVKPEYFPEGQKTLDELIVKKLVVVW